MLPSSGNSFFDHFDNIPLSIEEGAQKKIVQKGSVRVDRK